MLVTATSSLSPFYGAQRQTVGTASDKRPPKASKQASGDEKSASLQLTPEQQRQLAALKTRDQAVRNHEQAHLSAAGSIAVSGAHFNYVTGPDGQRYASGGDVSIDTSEVSGDPAATLRKAEIIRRAALAPANPSGQDQSVAAAASAMANKARVDLLNSHLGTIRSDNLIDTQA